VKQHELKDLSRAELEIKLQEDREALANLHFQKALQQLEHPQQLKLLRREIAQIKTVIREFDLGIRQES